MLARVSSIVARPMATPGHILRPAPNGRSSKCAPLKSVSLPSNLSGVVAPDGRVPADGPRVDEEPGLGRHVVAADGDSLGASSGTAGCSRSVSLSTILRYTGSRPAAAAAALQLKRPMSLSTSASLVFQVAWTRRMLRSSTTKSLRISRQYSPWARTPRPCGRRHHHRRHHAQAQKHDGPVAPRQLTQAPVGQRPHDLVQVAQDRKPPRTGRQVVEATTTFASSCCCKSEDEEERQDNDQLPLPLLRQRAAAHR
nr:unnamed protein product [Digitaria exilis]